MFYFRVIVLALLCSSCSCDLIQATSMEAAVGTDFNLTCAHPSLATSDYIHWYKISPGQGPLFLVNGYSNAVSESKKFHLLFESGGRKSSVLLIRNIEPKDSAVYLCAKSYSGDNRLTFGKGTQLYVIPKSERTDPSVYKLKSKQDDGLPKSVCLVTDFPNPQTSLKVDGIDSSLNVSAVLDKSTNDIWRYSTVVWNNNKDVDCRVQYGDGPEKTPKSDPENAEESCSSLSIDASFRTNPNMNTSSLTVLGFRIVTAKAIIFNLIITLRLWSS